MKRQRSIGFTLVELLVVIGVIALLIAILLPVLGSARRQAARTACGANLRQWGYVIRMYVDENKGFVPRSQNFGQNVDGWWKNTKYTGNNANALATWKNGRAREMGIDKIDPFIKGFRVVDGGKGDKVSGIWICPGVTSGNTLSLPPWWAASVASHLHYAYYGRVAEWDSSLVSVPNPDDLTNDRLSATKLLMSDMVFYREWNNGQTNTWMYNHGRRNHAAVVDGAGRTDNWVANSSGLSGANQLFGDGHVEWRSVEEMQLDYSTSQRCISSPSPTCTTYRFY